MCAGGNNLVVISDRLERRTQNPERGTQNAERRIKIKNKIYLRLLEYILHKRAKSSENQIYPIFEPDSLSFPIILFSETSRTLR